MDPETPQQVTTHAHAISLSGFPAHWPGQIDLLSWAEHMRPGEAAILLIAGAIYLLFGYLIFKALVTLNAAVVGGFIGAMIGEKGGSMFAGAIAGACLAGAATWPLMKYAVALMGGIFGTLLGASLWRQWGVDPSLTWAGALIGLIFFGLLSFIVYKGSVMMYTSLQGSVMLIFGILGLIYKYKEIAPSVTANMTAKSFLLPLFIFVPAILGLIYQHHNNTAEAAAAGGGKKK